MSQNVDDILRELSGLTFQPQESAQEDVLYSASSSEPAVKVSRGGHTPSVTETLAAVRELIGEPESFTEQTEALEDALEEDSPSVPEETAPLLKPLSEEKRESPREQKAPAERKRPRFTPVVRLSRRELLKEESDSAPSLPEASRRETAVLAAEKDDTVRFVSSAPVSHEGRLSGGAALRSVTRKASSGEEENFPESGKETRRIPALQEETDAVSSEAAAVNSEEKLSDTEEKTRTIGAERASGAADEHVLSDLPPDSSDEEVETLLSQVEALEEEPVPELSRDELRRLKKEQQEGNERLKREKEKKREQKKAQRTENTEDSGEKNLYRVRETRSGESQSGFAPAFSRLSGLNSAEQLSGWRKALRELAGSSMGFGLLLLFLSGVSLLLICLLPLLGESGEKALFLSNAAVGILGGVIGFPVIVGGIGSFFRFREDRDILPSIVYLATVIPAVVFAVQSLLPAAEGASGRYPPLFLPVGLAALALAYFSRWVTASTALRNLRFIHSGGNKFYLHVIRDGRLSAEMTRGVVDGPAFVAVNRQTESISDFMKLSFSSDDSDRFSRNLSMIGLPAGAFALGFSLLFGWDLTDALTLMSAVICLFSPLTALFIFSYPSRRVSRFMERAGGAVIGERAVSRYSLLNGAVMDARDIFPAGFVTLSGLKTYGSARVDDVIVDAASLVKNSGSILEDIFDGIIGRESGLLRSVEERRYEDGLGLSGFIRDRQVLLGSRALLESRGIRLSLDEHRNWNAGVGCACVYLAVAGELAGVFLIRLQSSLRSEEAVQTFADNGIRLSVRTSDSFLTPRLIGRLFRVNPELIKILPARLGIYVDRLQGRVRVKQPVAVNNGSLSGFAGCAACARRLAFMEGLNRVLTVLSVVLGLSMLLTLSVLGAFSSVTPLIMTGYALFWPVLGLILQKMIRI